MKKAILLILSFILITKLSAQNFKDFNKQRREFALIHIGINGFVGGLGALVNKRKDEKKIKVFLKGFGQGCLGGTFQVIGKDLTYQIKTKEKLSYVWASRITNSIGNSITQNAASNINFWERWHFNLGFLRFDYQITRKEFKVRLFPSSIFGTVISASQGKFNLKKTLQTGIMVYERDGSEGGSGMVSSIVMPKDLIGEQFYELMAHETMHILQYDNMVWINPFFNQLDSKLKEKSQFYQKAKKFIYFDFNGITILGLYMTQIHRPWGCRFIEREADHYAARNLGLYSSLISFSKCK